ncbi:helix-turn-helix domain-containing protein [Aurantiacibacter rhizosphaerae]|uniref:Helix-turn-helix domain-containing protein n=1 Tax=Aurantiacibacter rhizosphaerae TaxID=2691582 RepID=A0A844XD61_9SPHN|nr:AraC family transcriptional regulator [Aurantiacibacter rhizosphaerae]MWV27770.1 helix-turn-helix domain-containing protein [Aurantiacibacter rhizosphaerae]
MSASVQTASRPAPLQPGNAPHHRMENVSFAPQTRSRLETEVRFRKLLTGAQVNPLDGINLVASSRALNWEGMKLEVGVSRGLDVEDLVVDGHYLVLNLGEETIELETKRDDEWVSASLPPKSFWINTEGHPFSLRHSSHTYFATCLIDGGYLDNRVGHHCALQNVCGASDRLLASLMEAMIACLFEQQADEKTRQLSNEIIGNFLDALAMRFGKRVGACVNKGGIAPSQLRALKSWAESRLDQSLSVADMAARVELSSAHFSREFKRSTGTTPWRFIIDLRLKKARHAIYSGYSVGEAAAVAGFSDQAHLTRAFKQSYGLPPATFLRSCGRSSRHTLVDGN